MKSLIIALLLLVSNINFAQKTVQDKAKMCKVLTEMQDEDQRHRKKISFNNDTYSKKEIDSIWQLQLEIDHRNTKKLIELTKKYGWISDELINCPKLNIWVIFRHAPKKYFSEISELIEKEHNAKRLKNFHYRIIKNHLQGRPPMNN